MEIATLPCGLVVDLDLGECCKRSCLDETKRHCDTRRPHNVIERCYNRLKAREYLMQAERESGSSAMELYRAVCRLRGHQWNKLGGRLRQCSRCGVVGMAPPDKKAES